MKVLHEVSQFFLINVQSLNKYFDDLRNDIRFRNADVICLTVTWLKPDQNVKKCDMNGFKFHYASRGASYEESKHTFDISSAKGGGVAVYLSESEVVKTIVCFPEKNIEGISIQFINCDVVVVTYRN